MSASDSSTLLDVVAIDGPAGAGKSTIAKAVAFRLGWAHLDTGSMYRAVTLWFLDQDVALGDARAIDEALGRIHLRCGGSGRVWLDDAEVTEHLRAARVEALVSEVAAIPSVRRSMRDLQRAQAEHGPLVVEGRDMTSVVFPDARWKFYVDASARERARRRRGDIELQRGSDADLPSLDDVQRDLEERDRLDSTRADSPLRRVDAATYLDTTGVGIDEAVAWIVDLVEEDLTRDPEEGTE
ncbi:MAG: (d)CMP kinase [Planctomycetes bacterium]|nr:(d)CMP kinase [Planctomycetota bacterium]